MRKTNDEEFHEEESVDIDEDNKQAQPKTQKRYRNKEAYEVIHFFEDQCFKDLKARPTIPFSSAYPMVIKALKRLNKKQAIDMIDDWFGKQKPPEIHMNIRAVFAYKNIDAYCYDHDIQ